MFHCALIDARILELAFVSALYFFAVEHRAL